MEMFDRTLVGVLAEHEEATPALARQKQEIERVRAEAWSTNQRSPQGTELGQLQDATLPSDDNLQVIQPALNVEGVITTNLVLYKSIPELSCRRIWHCQV
ncbi:MLP1_4 [Sanghuangporus weigelae]